MPRIAVTGGVSEGKSTVLGYCRELGHSTISADDVVRDLLQSEEIRSSVFREAALVVGAPSSDLRMVMTRSERTRRAVNSLLHKPVWQKLIASDSTFVEVPLLYETCLQAEFDLVWVVTCGLDQQLSRLTGRLRDIREARALIACQLPSELKAHLADRVLRTDCPETSVREAVGAAVRVDVPPP